MPKNKLNPAQKEAVEYTGGPLLIVAGAGTGKTSVITEKIAYLIKNKLALPENILALTFTDKAAQEMEDRVEKMIDVGYAEMTISTFHSFCQHLLERHGLEIGLSTNFKLLTQTDTWLMVRKNLEKFDLDYYRPLGNPAKHIHELIKHFSKCKDELITAADYLKYAESVKLEKGDANVDKKSRLTELAGAYHTYNQLLLDNNAFDFGDLMYYAFELLNKRPSLLAALQERYKYILVDEFQDVNWAQYQLVKLLASRGSQLTVVGDDDQSIYAFRGASVANILRFKDDYPCAKEIVLTENYRSRQPILDAAYKLVRGNDPDRLEVKLKIDKQLKAAGETKAARGKEQSVVHVHLPKLDDEVQFVVDEILRLKKTDKDATWDDFAILARANNHVAPFISALEKKNIPYEYLASSGLFRQSIVMDAINFFKAVDNYHESAAIFRLWHLPPFNLSSLDIQKLVYYAKKKTISYFEATKSATAIKISSEGEKICQKLISLLERGHVSARADKPTVTLYKFFHDSGYLEYLARGDSAGEREILRQIRFLEQFFEYVKKYEESSLHSSIAGFVEHYQYVTEAGDDGEMRDLKETPDTVNVLTVHKAKGLEFKYVFVVNLVEDRFPGRRRGDGIELPLSLVKEQLPEGDIHYEEERRLFYVAMTRAKERLYLLSSEDYGGSRAKKISRFLAELGFTATSSEKENAKDRLSLYLGGEKAAVEISYEIPEKFSFSQLKSYGICPYQYKLGTILKIPTLGRAALTFGNCIHSTLQKFYVKVQQLNSSTQESLFEKKSKKLSTAEIKVPSLAELEKFYEESWNNDWFESRSQRDDYRKKGLKILRTFYQSQTGKWTVPVILENGFKFRLGKFIISGRIDRADQLPNGKLEIVDYKTGQSKEKLNSEDKDQLMIYQMAVEQTPVYKNIGAPEKLTYYYLEDNLQVSFLGEQAEMEALSQKLIELMERIERQDFQATPSEFVCSRCDFADICDWRV